MKADSLQGCTLLWATGTRWDMHCLLRMHCRQTSQLTATKSAGYSREAPKSMRCSMSVGSSYRKLPLQHTRNVTSGSHATAPNCLLSSQGCLVPAVQQVVYRQPTGEVSGAQLSPVGVRLHEAPVEQLVQGQLQQARAHRTAHLRRQMLHLCSAARASRYCHKHAVAVTLHSEYSFNTLCHSISSVAAPGPLVHRAHAL